jgi:hypothetical protein
MSAKPGGATTATGFPSRDARSMASTFIRLRSLNRCRVGFCPLFGAKLIAATPPQRGILGTVDHSTPPFSLTQHTLRSRMRLGKSGRADIAGYSDKVLRGRQVPCISTAPIRPTHESFVNHFVNGGASPCHPSLAVYCRDCVRDQMLHGTKVQQQGRRRIDTVLPADRYGSNRLRIGSCSRWA